MERRDSSSISKGIVTGSKVATPGETGDAPRDGSARETAKSGLIRLSFSAGNSTKFTRSSLV